jgi:hypothetical protein
MSLAPRKDGASRVDLLPRQVYAATWPTPTVVNRERDEATMAKCAAFRKRNANQNTVPLYLPEVVRQTATWPTPTSLTKSTDEYNGAGNSAGLVAIRNHALAATWGTPTVQAARHATLSPAEQKRDPGNLWVQVYAATAPSGPTSSGSQAQTEKRGALNPAFPCYLMGYPEEWLWCAPAQPGRKKRTSTAASDL